MPFTSFATRLVVKRQGPSPVSFGSFGTVCLEKHAMLGAASLLSLLDASS
jgi:hypothetical protein